MNWLTKCLCFVVFASLLLQCGCNFKTKLERTSQKLKPGMNREQVSVLFKDFNGYENNFEGQLYNFSDWGKKGVAYQTNFFIGKSVTYGLKNSGLSDLFELCDVCFDTNGTIVGYRYDKDQ